VAAGAKVEVLARRRVGPVTRVCDVRDTDACETSVNEAIEALGGLDAMVYAAGVAPLALATGAAPEEWHDTFDTNVVGAARVAVAALPHLAVHRGRGLFLSSDSVGDPRDGLALYAASKAALEQLVLGLRREHPEVRWTTVVVGPTATNIARGWDATLVRQLWPRWRSRGLDARPALDPDSVAERIVEMLADPGNPARVETHGSPSGAPV
jgi:NAD(P)-dependent dehydrogenase (short-subunit alcohol dehydrogenase family)